MAIVGYKQINSQGGTSKLFALAIEASAGSVGTNGYCTVSGALRMFCAWSSVPYYQWSHTVKFTINGTSKHNGALNEPNTSGDWVTTSTTINSKAYKRYCQIGSWSESVYVGYNTTKSVSITGSYSVSGSASYLPVTGTHSVSGSVTTGSRAMPTNTIGHWTNGYVNGEGNNGNKTAFNMGDTTFTAVSGTTVTLGTDRARTCPKGYSLGNINTPAITGGTWTTYPFGTTYTQGNSAMYFEYWYHLQNYTITYNLNGGTNNSSNPSTYNVLYGVTFQNPTRDGYTFTGWTDSNGNKITGINQGAIAPFSSGDDMINKCNSRTTGNITVNANWEANQAQAYAKVNGAWVKGYVWTKVNGTWVKGKRIYGKSGGTWVG